MSGLAGEPRWLDPEPGDDVCIRALGHVRAGGGVVRVLALVMGAALVGMLAVLSIGDGPAVPSVTEEPAARQSPGDGVTDPMLRSVPAAGSDAGTMSDLENLDSVFRMVVSPADGEGSALLTVDPEAGSSISELPGLSRFEFDSTGDWLAGLSVTRWGHPRRVLWAGPSGRPMEPIAFDVMAFAWHDTRPGLIAFSGTDRDSVSVMDLARNEPAETVPLAAEGAVRGWGDWGFAVETSSPTTAIVAPVGTLLHEAVPGTYRGTLPDGRLAMSGRRRGVSFAVDPVSGRVDRLDGLPTDAFVVRLADARGSDRAVAMVSHTGVPNARFDGSIFSIDPAGKLDHAGAVYVFADVDLESGDSIAILAEQSDDDRTATVSATLADDPTVLPFSSGVRWVAAVSVR